jgi:hypothetical protein
VSGRRTKIGFRRGGRAREAVRVRRLFPLAVACALAAAGACSNDRLRSSGEQVEAVSGNPGVGQDLPGVDRADGGTGATFGSAAPFQVDSFDQQQIQKVDILWIISDSGAMQAKQDRVKANFLSFMRFLQQQKTDFHLGVITADVFNPKESGRLVNAAGLAAPWIDSTSANPDVAFVANASVGTSRSYDVKPLFAGMLALTPPLSPASPASPDAGAANCANGAGGLTCFLRSDAPLYVVIVADHEDNSCAPINASSREGCDDAAASLTGYGAIDYWTRFYSGIKGPGGQVKVAAIVASAAQHYDCAGTFAQLCTKYGIEGAGKCGGAAAPNCNLGTNASHPCCQALRACYNDLTLRAPYCTFSNVVNAAGSAAVAPYYTISGSIEGCVSAPADGGVPDFAAWSAARTTQVALATGGVATSICEQDYTPALAKLGLQAAGLRGEFPLSRIPIGTSLSLTVDGVTQPQAGGAYPWTWVGCESQAALNVIRFAAPPPAGSKVVVSYNVEVRGLGTCP